MHEIIFKNFKFQEKTLKFNIVGNFFKIDSILCSVNKFFINCKNEIYPLEIEKTYELQVYPFILNLHILKDTSFFLFQLYFCSIVFQQY